MPIFKPKYIETRLFISGEVSVWFHMPWLAIDQHQTVYRLDRQEDIQSRLPNNQ
jgi:hypothetical protein